MERFPGGFAMTTPVPRVERLDRLAVAGLLAGTAIAGMLFTPVFGARPLLLPILVVVVLSYACVEACAALPRLRPWRPAVVLVVGLLGVVESVLFGTTVAGLPTGASLTALGRGFSQAWLLTLQSTWPARPDAGQLSFVPLAVLCAAVLGLELLLRLGKPALALLPGLAVVGLAQAYQALSGVAGIVAVVGYVAAAGLVLSPRRGGLRWVSVLLVAGVVGAVAVGGLDPAGRAPYELQASHLAPLRPQEISDPLDEIADRLADPDQVVFRYTSSAPVEQWRLVALSGFDGANWSADLSPRRLGTGFAAPPDTTTRSAEVEPAGLTGPWLPSQSVPLDVTGVSPLIDQSTGTLMLDSAAPASYGLIWSEPTINASSLGAAAVDAGAPGGLGGLGTVPAGIDALARKATAGLRPTFQAALQLERFLATNYQVATGADLPTGHGWPQLAYFLTKSKRGTSEQFAASYVLLARLIGIPARLVVGFRGSTDPGNGVRVVRNRDVLAWPEVAVAGVGWVPLDPTEGAARSGGTGSGGGTGLAGAVAAARQQLPPANDLRPAQLPAGAGGSAARQLSNVDAGQLLIVAVVLLALLLCWLAGVPMGRWARSRVRRRRSGADGVIGAWTEARDRLRAHGVPYRIGMTPRDVATSGDPVVGARTSASVMRLARVVDMALWSGVLVTDGTVRRAWDEVGEIRGGLAKRSWRIRLWAAVNLRSLLPPAGSRRERPRRERSWLR
ncbi:MAG TPA: transglutaminaseTgpA domain-containing protein [Pseudonocardiaceae bacterium]|nr:transglutaminaseTgpA domain-containing protein [Pseudonocardiaceae bacterium]